MRRGPAPGDAVTRDLRGERVVSPLPLVRCNFICLYIFERLVSSVMFNVYECPVHSPPSVVIPI